MSSTPTSGGPDVPAADGPVIQVSATPAASTNSKEELVAFLARLRFREPLVIGNVAVAKARLAQAQEDLKAAQVVVAAALDNVQSAEDSVVRLNNLIADTNRQLGA